VSQKETDKIKPIKTLSYVYFIGFYLSLREIKATQWPIFSAQEAAKEGSFIKFFATFDDYQWHATDPKPNKSTNSTTRS